MDLTDREVSVGRSRSRAGRKTAVYFRHEDFKAVDVPARQKCGGGKKRKKGKKKKKHERSHTRQPYMNTCLSTPYLSSKFKH